MRRDRGSGPAHPATKAACSLLSQLLPLPASDDSASYLLTDQTRATLQRNLYLRLVESLPSPSHLLPGDTSRSSHDAVDLIAAHGWSLSKAQIEEARQIAHSKKKGKQAQRANSPWTGFDASDDIDDPDLLGPEYAEERRGMPCGHLFQKGEAIYRCRDCGLDDTCVQCAPCFQASIHAKEGHDIVFSVSTSSGGCCDCGDPEAWTQDVCCRYHSENADVLSSDDANRDLAMDLETDAPPISSDGGAGDGLSGSLATPGADELDGLDEIRTATSNIHAEIRDPLLGMVNDLITLVLTVMDHAPDEISLPPLQDAMDAITRLPSLEEGRSRYTGGSKASSRYFSGNSDGADSDEEMSAVEVEDLVGDSIDDDLSDRDDLASVNKADDEPSSSWRPAARRSYWRPTSADGSSSYSRHPRSSAPEDTTDDFDLGRSRGDRQYAVVLWNDEKHSFSQVIDIVTDATGRSEHEAKNVAERVDKHGREIIEVSTDVRRLYQIARVLASIDLAVTLRPAFDIFAEEVVQMVLQFLMDLSNSNLYLSQHSNSRSGAAPTQHPLRADAAILKQIIAQALFVPFHPIEPISAGSMSPDYFDPSSLSNYEGLLLMDYKFWKSARIEIKALFMSLIARREIKKEISLRFAKVYPKLVETFMLRDREQEYSICFLTVQLFSVPSIATMLVERTSFLEKMLKLLQSIFTGLLANEKQNLILPPPSPPRGQANVHLMFIRQGRSYHIFYDIRYLLAAEGVQKLIARDAQPHLDYFLKCLSLFQAINPSKRAVSAHVEFESEIWIPVFHVSSHLGKAAKMMGEAFAFAEPQQLAVALTHTAQMILWSCVELQVADPETHPPVTFHDVDLGIGNGSVVKSHSVVNFAVDCQPVSFHHPMHWLLAELLKQVSVVGHERIQSWSGKSRINELLLPAVEEKALLIVLDFPLRVCVKLAQIRCNLWVRNGFVIRSQAHHYRDNSMRGIMYDQDLFLVQAGLALVDTDRFLLSMLDRFNLIDWFRYRNISSSNPCDAGQGVFMAEELLFLLTTCLTEVAALCAWPIEKQIRREIVHFLALGQGTFTDVTKHIPEKFTDHASFERILSQVSQFRAPDGTHDFGIFELRDECYDEIQPFFFHYTRNQREKVEEVLRTRQKKRVAQRTGKPAVSIKDEDLPPVPPMAQLKQLEGTLFSRLPEVLTNDTLLSVLFWALDNTRVLFSYAPDMLVDAALQLVMVGLIEVEAGFASKATSVVVDTIAEGTEDDDKQPDIPQGTLVKLLCRIELLDKFKSFRPKITWCLNKIAGASAEAQQTIHAHFAATGRGALAAGIEGGHKTKQQTAEEARRAAAKARQAAIMQKFSAQQKSLLDQFEAEDDDDDDDEDEVDAATSSVNDAKAPKKSFGSCILCQENLGADKAFGSLAHIQPSRMMRMTPKQDAGSLQQALETPLTLDRSGGDGRRVMGAPPSGRSSSLNQSSGKGKGRSGPAYGSFPQEDHRFGFHASACGHLMHLHCFETYCRSVEQRHTQQIARNHPEDLHRSEFICPLCKSLGNVILPVAEATIASGSEAEAVGSAFASMQTTKANETPLQDWVRMINIEILKHSSKTDVADYQETDHGSGAFLPFFVEHSQSSLQMRLEIANIDRSTAHMIDRLINVLKPMSHATKTMRERFQQQTILAPQSRKMYIPEELVVYTIAMMEAAQRGMTPSPSTDCPVPVESRKVSDALNDSSLDLLRSLIHCLRTLTLTYHEGSKGPSIIRRGLLKRLLPHWGGDDAVRSPLLLRDPMTILVEAAVVAPDSLSQCTALMYYVCLIQTVFGLAQPSIWPQIYGHSGSAYGAAAGARLGAGLKSDHVSKEDLIEARNVFPDVRWTVANIIGFVGYARGNITLGFDNLDDDTLAKMLCSYTLPFLRRAAILRRVVGLQSSSPADVAMAMAQDADGLGESVGEYRRLLAELNIPTPAVALPARAEKQTPIASLVEGWIKHAYVPLASLFRPLPIQPATLGGSMLGGHGPHHAAGVPNDRPSSAAANASSSSASLAAGTLGRSSAGLNSLTSSYLQAAEAHPTLLLEHPHIYELARLPTDLAVLLQDTRKRVCKKCGDVPPEPALCLLCGEVVCFQSFCCQSEEDGERGECNQHTDVCGGATGVFFKIKSNVVMLLYQGNGTFHFLSPYLDSHGEIDVGLRKGRPQKLHQQRYDELRKQVWSHGVANIVARKIEAAMDQGGWQTF
ncbi:hypothetical protein BCV70DRAFT_9664 [Testicularia cyperi]|uniref:E3 ubiquitin-protein ligase n=1 Tax=Testicularia cyperi TaxID=1882483 RepID=A0A317XYM3_9BASI|nr:hypothetical protein BCV70DRAFT_9664 [Testicularia cyperi]